MRSACAALNESIRRSLGLRSSLDAHSIEPAHGARASSSSLWGVFSASIIFSISHWFVCEMVLLGLIFGFVCWFAAIAIQLLAGSPLTASLDPGWVLCPLQVSISSSLLSVSGSPHMDSMIALHHIPPPFPGVSNSNSFPGSRFLLFCTCFPR